MKKLLAMVVVASIVVGCGRVNVPLPPTPAIDTAKAESDLIKAHNDIRASNFKPPLTMNPLLMQAAAAHSQDMADHTFMSHRGSDWASPFTRINRTGYKWRAAGENVAAGQGTVESVMKAWMSDIGHRSNVLGSYKDIGVSVRVGANGTPYWTTDFGTSE
jgi:uncharacterized protein YkwD